ncbi:MAG: FkbM family methyltransferase, partial [Pseudomonadota bacterium]
MNTSDPDIARWKFIAKHTPNQTQPVIVDVGANPLENPPFKKLVETGLCRVHGFEPQAQAFARLQETKGPNEDYENCAVGDGRTHPFHVYRQSGLSSIFSLDRSAMQFLGRPDRPAQLLDHFAVKTKRLNDVNLAGDLDLLKIDAQGAETMIFDHGTDKLQN